MKSGTGFLVCVAVAAMLLSSCAQPQRPGVITQAKDLAGVWHTTTPNSFGDEVYRQFTADGIFRMGGDPQELEARPRVKGEFWFEGDQFLMRDVAAQPGYDACVQESKVGRYTVERLGIRLRRLEITA